MIYRRTQFGWALLVALAIPASILLTVAILGDNRSLLITLLPLAIIFPLFGWLTITVDDDAVTAKFGIGIVSYRLPVTSIVTTEVVHNPWTWGWGVRIIPGGRMYNVSGLRSVEFVLADGRRIRFGTNDPEALQAAVRSVVAPGRTAHGGDIVAPARIGRGLALVAAAVVLSVLSVLWIATRPVVVSTENGALSIDGGGYHARVALRDVQRVRLDESLPDFRMRTNGVGVGGELRGHFRLADGRSAQVFVSRRHPPFILVDTSSGPIIVNMSNPASTRRLFDEISSRVAERR
jgi:hypothetical protein